MWQKWPAGLKTTLCHSLCLERLRGCSQTQQLCKNNKTASWDIDWSSDVTSSWGWRQEDKNSQWDRAFPAPSKQFLTALISTNQFPVFRQPLVIHHLPAFITSSSSFLYSKAKFQVAFIIIFFISFCLKWLSPPLPLSPSTLNSQFSHRLRRELFFTPTRRHAFFKKIVNHLAIFSGFFGWGFLRPSPASLDQSMLREDERSKFKYHLSTAPESNQKYLKFLTLPPPLFLFTSSPLLCYVAVGNLCIYFCCYLIIIIIIIYCFRTRFALFEDEFQ